MKNYNTPVAEILVLQDQDILTSSDNFLDDIFIIVEISISCVCKI